MIKLGVLLFAISELAMAINEHNFAKLVENLEKLEKENIQSIENYHKNGYYTFEKLAKHYSATYLSAELKELMRVTPKDRPVQSNPQVKRAYERLKPSDYSLPQVNRPTWHADGFKASMLQRIVLNRVPDPQAQAELKRDVMQIIAEENKIDRKFDRPSKTLEALYVEMKEKHYVGMLFNSEGYTFLMKNVQDYCNLRAGNCDGKLTGELTKYFGIDQQIRAAFPLNSAEKAEMMLTAMKEFRTMTSVLDVSLHRNKLNCQLSGCEKLQF